MILLMLGFVIFVIPHVAIAWPGGRSKLHNRFGHWTVKGSVAVLSVAGLGLMALGYGMAGFYPVWTPWPFGRELGAMLMPVASILLVAAYVPNNLKRFTAHPMLWAVVLWAVTHLAVRGDWAAVVLFGGLGLYALLAMALAWIRGVRPSPTPRGVWWDGLVVVVGLMVYGGLLFVHPHLLGVSVLT